MWIGLSRGKWGEIGKAELQSMECYGRTTHAKYNRLVILLERPVPDKYLRTSELASITAIADCQKFMTPNRRGRENKGDLGINNEMPIQRNRHDTTSWMDRQPLLRYRLWVHRLYLHYLLMFEGMISISQLSSRKRTLNPGPLYCLQTDRLLPLPPQQGS